MPEAALPWSTAVPDWRERIMEGRSLLPDLPLFDAVAEKALRIFKRLRVPDLIGTPTYGEVCEEWVFDLVRAIFGAYDPEAKKRMIQEFFLLVPKKNGKSAIAAAIILTAAIMNERPAAECILIAPTQEIAKIAFKQIAGMVALDPELATIFHVRDHLKIIVHRDTRAEIKILSADGDIVTGSKATYILVDETHVLATKHKAPEVLIEIRGGLAARPEGFMLQITTQSKDAPAGEFRSELSRARAVRDGRSTANLLAVLYELPPEIAKEEAWRDEATWGLVNPNLDRSVSTEWLRNALMTAEEKGPESLALFASQHFNVEIGLGLHTDRWAGADTWVSCADPEMSFEKLMDTSEVVVVGGDVGGADDLFALAFLGRERGTGIWQTWVHAWAVDQVLERRKEIAPRLRDFATEGCLTITETAEEHISAAAQMIAVVADRGLLPAEYAVGLDPYGTAALIFALDAAGISAEQRAGVKQGGYLSGAIKGLERRLLDGNLRHGNQGVLNWSVSNAKAEARGDNVVITKQKAGSAKIDALVALFNAATLMDRNPQVSAATPWDYDPDYRMVG